MPDHTAILRVPEVTDTVHMVAVHTAVALKLQLFNRKFYEVISSFLNMHG